MNCFLCGSGDNQEFARVDSFGFPLVYYQCNTCGLIFQSSEENQAIDPHFYAETYRRIYQSSIDPTAKDLWVQGHRAFSLISVLNTLKIASLEHILDIGASSGILLETMRSSFEANVIGVEPGDAYRAHAENRGIEMYASVEDLIGNHPPKFDLVSMIHVLEHLADPIGMLKTIRTDLLKENGILMLEVPNFYTHDSYELAHLACYTPHTLQQALRQAGYHVFFFHRHGFPRSELLNLYLLVLAQPLPAEIPIPDVDPDQGVRFKRQMGLLYRRAVQKLFPHRAWLPIPDVKV